MGLVCDSAPPGHFLQAGQLLLRLNKMVVVDSLTGQTEEPFEKEYLSLSQSQAPWPIKSTEQEKADKSLINNLRTDVDRISASVETIQKEMQGFKNFVHDVRVNLTKRSQEMFELRDAVAADDVRALAITVAKVSNKAGQVDALMMEVQLLKNKLKRFESRQSEYGQYTPTFATDIARPRPRSSDSRQRAVSGIDRPATPLSGAKKRRADTDDDTTSALQPRTTSTVNKANKKTSRISTTSAIENDEENASTINAMDVDDSRVFTEHDDSILEPPPAKRKRGRPSKIEIAQREAWSKAQAEKAEAQGTDRENGRTGAAFDDSEAEYESEIPAQARPHAKTTPVVKRGRGRPPKARQFDVDGCPLTADGKRDKRWKGNRTFMSAAGSARKPAVDTDGEPLDGNYGEDTRMSGARGYDNEDDDFSEFINNGENHGVKNRDRLAKEMIEREMADEE